MESKEPRLTKAQKDIKETNRKITKKEKEFKNWKDMKKEDFLNEDLAALETFISKSGQGHGKLFVRLNEFVTIEKNSYDQKDPISKEKILLALIDLNKNTYDIIRGKKPVRFYAGTKELATGEHFDYIRMVIFLSQDNYYSTYLTKEQVKLFYATGLDKEYHLHNSTKEPEEQKLTIEDLFG